MLKAIKLTLVFWLEILGRAVISSWVYIREHLLTALLLLVTYYVVVWLTTNGIVDYAVAEGYLSDISSQVRLIYSAFLFMVVYLLINLVYQPAKLYNEQREALKKWEGESVVSEKIELKPKREILVGTFVTVFISVENNENWDLEECYAVLKCLKVYQDGAWADITGEKNPYNKTFTWSFQSKKSYKNIKRHNFARLEIAKTVLDGFIFGFEDEDSRNYSSYSRMKDARYYIEIGVNGTLNKKSIREKSLHGFLTYVDILSLREAGIKRDKEDELSFELGDL